MYRVEWDRRKALRLVVYLVVAGSLTSCALWQLSQPPGAQIAPRKCDGTFVYPDSAGHCIPQDTVPFSPKGRISEGR